jgi:protein-S-isoprenylcysteine O-methyltransferase Ste14
MIENKQNIKKNSVAKWYDPFVTVLVVLVSYFSMVKTGLSNVELVLAITFFTTFWMFAVELLRRDWQSVKETKVKVSIRTTINNIVTKYLGILLGICLIFFMYWLIPEYALPKYTNAISEAKYLFLPFFLPLSLLLVIVTEFVLGPKHDGTYQFGLLVKMQPEKIDWKIFKDGVFEWLVRLVFLTLNFTTSVALVNTYRQVNFFQVSDFITFVVSFENILLLFIILAILPGYVFSSRLINTDVRKVDTTWFGWVITLVCYAPFFQPIFNQVLNYSPSVTVHNGSPVWVSLTQSIPTLMFVIAFLILFFELVHLWGEAIIGVRSSNLTNRGIITTGPFAFTKHPVYVAKCFSWALMVMPFINSTDFLDSFRLGILFLINCGIVRAGRMGYTTL